MGAFFEAFSKDRCCLCGSAERLTGEHKIKASALKSIFGRAPMVIGHFDGLTEPRDAQGPKSRAFHFSARLCGDCNSSRTQQADFEFVRFHESALALHLEGNDPGSVFRSNRYAIGTEAYLNVFRYFAKLLACQVAESRGPRFLAIVNFASGQSDINPIKLSLEPDLFYREYSTLIAKSGFAAHGGLSTRGDSKTELPNNLESSLTLGPLRYTFGVGFSSGVAIALKAFDQIFFDKCQAAYRAAIADHSQAERAKLNSS